MNSSSTLSEWWLVLVDFKKEYGILQKDLPSLTRRNKNMKEWEGEERMNKWREGKGFFNTIPDILLLISDYFGLYLDDILYYF